VSFMPGNTVTLKEEQGPVIPSQASFMTALLWKEDSSIPVEASCLDFNARGVLLNSNEEIAPGSKVTVSMYRTSNRTFLASYSTEVLRCNKNQNGDYSVGLGIIRN